MSYAMEDWSRLHRITVDEFYRMAEVGLLAPDARVELIEGVIIDMAPIGTFHAVAVDRLVKLLIPAVGERAVVRVQGPVTLSRDSEPLPDIALLKVLPRGYTEAHPSGADTLLAIEVSDTTLRYDRNIKLPLYARHGVHEVWIADVNRSGIHICRSRKDLGYSDIHFIAEPGLLAMPSLGDVSVDLTGLFVFD
jgi:Uma2 family endonuclease